MSATRSQSQSMEQDSQPNNSDQSNEATSLLKKIKKNDRMENSDCDDENVKDNTENLINNDVEEENSLDEIEEIVEERPTQQKKSKGQQIIQAGLKFLWESTSGFLFPVALKGLQGAYDKADETGEFLTHSAANYDFQLFLNNTTSIAFNVMIGNALGFLLMRKPEDIRNHFRAVSNGNAGVGFAKDLARYGIAYSVLIGFHKFTSHINDGMLNDDWVADDNLALQALEFGILHPILAAFIQGTIGFALFKFFIKLFDFCMKKMEEEVHLAPKTPLRWLVQKFFQVFSALMMGEGVSTISEFYGLNISRNMFFPAIYFVAERLMSAWGHLALSEAPFASLPALVKNDHIFETKDENTNAVSMPDEASVTTREKVYSAGLIMIFNYVGLGVGVGFLYAMDQLRPEYNGELSLSTKVGLGFLTYTASDFVASVAKKTYNAAMSRFYPPARIEELNDDEPVIQNRLQK